MAYLQKTLHSMLPAPAYLPTNWSFQVGALAALVDPMAEVDIALTAGPLRLWLPSLSVGTQAAYAYNLTEPWRHLSLQYYSISGGKWAPVRSATTLRMLQEALAQVDGVIELTVAGENSKRLIGSLIECIAGPAIPKDIRTKRNACLASFLKAARAFLVLLQTAGVFGMIGGLWRRQDYVGASAYAAASLVPVVSRAYWRFGHKQGVGKVHRNVPEPTAVVMGDRVSAVVVRGDPADVQGFLGRPVSRRFSGTCHVFFTAMTFLWGSAVLFLFCNATLLAQVVVPVLVLLSYLEAKIARIQYLALKATHTSVTLESFTPCSTRTQVLATLAKKKGPVEWMSKAGIIPKTAAWKKWEEGLGGKAGSDADKWLEKCLGGEDSE